jgi:acetate CoA/acetoacetate CoA-transferase beta subunit
MRVEKQNSVRLAIFRSQTAQTIITELGVMKIKEMGLVLTEVAPGISTDNVKNQTAASIHVNDDIKVMEF